MLNASVEGFQIVLEEKGALIKKLCKNVISLRDFELQKRDM
ncbi:hypothetical protein [Methanosarcina mazei]|nr:hypothetical protein [Methanosarcina mazei]